MESFGLGWDVLSAINRRLIYCSISAFGRTGPRKDSAGYEALMQAFSGIMSITGEPGGAPCARACRSSTCPRDCSRRSAS
jgi:crotonobetainyl-CoA:carnitine CoA-transferase CaiB-like acyl-CoA transferase